MKQKWADLFGTQFDVLLYDLTSTYFEGETEQKPKARRGYSRDERPDCVQVVIALVVTPDGFPLAYEVMNGNTSDRTTLRDFLEKIEPIYGKARRVWVMDRGIPTEAVLEEMRAAGRRVLSGGHATRQDPAVREEVAGLAVAKGARLGGGEAVRRGRRVVRAGQE